jgi:DNA-binding transcriptional ArsR family regulator
MFRILSSPRRRETVRRLSRVADSISVRDLSEAIAQAETGLSPAPRQVRATVYVSLHQTHLPALEELDIIVYDREQKRVYPVGAARVYRRYMDVEAGYGVSWAALYRTLGVVGLGLLVASLAGVVPFSLVDPVLIGTAFLAAFSVAGLSELWSYRNEVVRLVRQRRREFDN